MLSVSTGELIIRDPGPSNPGCLSVCFILRFCSDSHNDLDPPVFCQGRARSIAPACSSGQVSDQDGIGPKETRRRVMHGRLSTTASVSMASSRRFAFLRNILCRRTRPVQKIPRRGKANRRPGHRTETEGPRSNPTRIAAAPVPRAGECKILAVRISKARNEPSAAYRESLRRTVEKRRQRHRARRGAATGTRHRARAHRRHCSPGPCPPP